MLSRDALRLAETQLREKSDGVRDEVGFLALHQGYADRFFPGTSVLHTRLRYVFFVPWLYRKIEERGARGSIAQALEKEEIVLAGRLKQSGEGGVIGQRSYPDATSQPPSMVYWTALGTWGLLKRLYDGSTPSRSTVHRRLASKSAPLRLKDDDQQWLDETEPVFRAIPDPPESWHAPETTLTFKLRRCETTLIRNCLLALTRPGTENTPCLLSNLAERSVQLTGNSTLWSHQVMKAANAEDRPALRRARQAAALAAVGRAVYAALVETVRASEDGVATQDIHRTNLGLVMDQYCGDALALDVDEIIDDVPGINRHILEVLRETQFWLQADRRSTVMALRDLYAEAEHRRKGRRARLMPTLFGREKRSEWDPDEHPKASPLHYRWGNVRRLLLDLQGTR